MDANHEDLDVILESALRAYSQAVPPAGLEARVLAHIRVARLRRRMAWWAGIGSVAATVAIALTLSQPRPAHRQAYAPSPPHVPAAVFVQPQPANRKQSHPRPGRTLPPSLALSPEERVLLAFTRNYPDQARHPFAVLPSTGLKPLDFAPIEIAPIEGAP